MVLILSIYIYLKRLDLTFLEKKHPIKAKLLRFEVANLQKQTSRVVFRRKVVLKICSKFIGEHLCWSLISTKLLCNSNSQMFLTILLKNCFKITLTPSSSQAGLQYYILRNFSIVAVKFLPYFGHYHFTHPPTPSHSHALRLTLSPLFITGCLCDPSLKSGCYGYLTPVFTTHDVSYVWK